MTALPWMKFYPADWRADPSLRMCGLAARGLWMEMLAIMHEATPRGLLLVSGRAVSPAQLATIVGTDLATVGALLDELEQAGVFSRKRTGVVFSRRMERDENLRRKNKENGKLGGNPTLCNNKENQGSVNPPLKAKSLEVRSQKIEDGRQEEKKEPLRGREDPPTGISEKSLFDLGKAVLGKSAGGVIVRLVKHHGGDRDLTAKTIRDAAERQDAMEWVQAVLRRPARSTDQTDPWRGVNCGPLTPEQREYALAMGLS